MPDSKKYFALIVEDTEDIAQIIAMTLSHLGIDSYHANNGARALEFFQQQIPDLLLLDIGLPGMSGWEVLEVVKTQHPEADFPVIVLTAFGDPANRVIGKLQRHVFRYFVKPFEVPELAKAVQEALGIGQ